MLPLLDAARELGCTVVGVIAASVLDVEIDVVGEYAHKVANHWLGQFLLQRRLIERVVEAHAAAVFVFFRAPKTADEHAAAPAAEHAPAADQTASVEGAPADGESAVARRP